MLRHFAAIIAVMGFLAYGCKGPPSTESRTINQTGEKGTLKLCLERAPAFYNAEVDSRLKAALPLAGKTEVQAEARVQAYLRQEAGGTKRGQDLQDYMNHICLMANNGNWSEATTERLLVLGIKTFMGEETGGKPKVEIKFRGRSQKELQAQFPIPLVLDNSLRAVLIFTIANLGNGPVLDTYGLVAAMPPDVRVGHRGAVFYEKPNHNLYQTKIGKILPREISGMDYELDADVRVPETIDTFNIVFRIYGDNLPYQDIKLDFKAIHPKRPGT